MKENQKQIVSVDEKGDEKLSNLAQKLQESFFQIYEKFNVTKFFGVRTCKTFLAFSKHQIIFSRIKFEDISSGVIVSYLQLYKTSPCKFSLEISDDILKNQWLEMIVE